MINGRWWTIVVGAAVLVACGGLRTGPVALDDDVVVAGDGPHRVDVLRNDRLPTGSSVASLVVSGGDDAAAVRGTAIEVRLHDGDTIGFSYTLTTSEGETAEARVTVRRRDAASEATDPVDDDDTDPATPEPPDPTTDPTESVELPELLTTVEQVSPPADHGTVEWQIVVTNLGPGNAGPFTQQVLDERDSLHDQVRVEGLAVDERHEWATTFVIPVRPFPTPPQLRVLDPAIEQATTPDADLQLPFRSPPRVTITGEAEGRLVYQLSAVAFDLDGDRSTLTWSAVPADGVALNIDDDTVDVTVDKSVICRESGRYTIQVVATDDDGDTGADTLDEVVSCID